MGPQAILEKINKLLALSESPNEFEASSALLKAQELLVKHNLSMSDVKGHSFGEDILKYGEIQVDYETQPWRLNLASVIAYNFRCYAIGRRANSTIVFLGTDVDVKVAESLYQYTSTFIERTYDTKMMGLLSFRKDYAMGFIDGLKAKFELQRATNKWELVLAKPSKVTEEFNSIINNSKVINKSKTHMKLNSEAYDMGFKDGKHCSPHSLESKTDNGDLYLEHEYRVDISQFIELLKTIPWMECFRTHPSYKLEADNVNRIYEEAKALLNHMENLEIQMASANISKEDIRQLKEIRLECRKSTVAFYRAFYTPQSQLDVKHEYECTYREGLEMLQNYLEYSTQIND